MSGLELFWLTLIEMYQENDLPVSAVSEVLFQNPETFQYFIAVNPLLQTDQAWGNKALF